MSPRRKGKKVVNKRTVEEEVAKHDDDNKIEKVEIQREEKKTEDFVDEEVEKKVGVVRAIRDIEIDQSITQLRMLRANFTEEQQLQTPILSFFKENLPDFTISKNEETEEIEFHNNNSNDDDDVHYSILKRLSMGFNDFYSRRPSLSSLGGGYDNVMRESLLGTDDDTQHLEKLLLQGSFESQMLTSYDALRTPGQSSVGSEQRMSFGMTPKTRRQPKPGEMMLSVHGSPLGVYQDDDNNNNTMGAINEENS